MTKTMLSGFSNGLLPSLSTYKRSQKKNHITICPPRDNEASSIINCTSLQGLQLPEMINNILKNLISYMKLSCCISKKSNEYDLHSPNINSMNISINCSKVHPRFCLTELFSSIL